MERKRLDRIEDKLDKVLEKAANTDVTLAKQSVILEEHVRRTNLLEQRMEPVERHVEKMTNIGKFMGKMLRHLIPVLIGAGGTHGIMHYLMKLY